jgi:hypothetical protein
LYRLFRTIPEGPCCGGLPLAERLSKSLLEFLSTYTTARISLAEAGQEPEKVQEWKL